MTTIRAAASNEAFPPCSSDARCFDMRASEDFGAPASPQYFADAGMAPPRGKTPRKSRARPRITLSLVGSPPTSFEASQQRPALFQRQGATLGHFIAYIQGKVGAISRILAYLLFSAHHFTEDFRLTYFTI